MPTVLRLFREAAEKLEIALDGGIYCGQFPILDCLFGSEAILKSQNRAGRTFNRPHRNKTSDGKTRNRPSTGTQRS